VDDSETQASDDLHGLVALSSLPTSQWAQR
jgi:hypothetical protein